ncbi:hypothetical protein [Oryzisolibacter propanilivorax]|uniref:hypothetical protein n=1 Tax=Oryzisolibacter propanilivorax TaxID=1527607 RepID=UPI001FDFBE8B|nr:hypothetical protein [Oryzisolibacter propanilivorax]
MTAVRSSWALIWATPVARFLPAAPEKAAGKARTSKVTGTDAAAGEQSADEWFSSVGIAAILHILANLWTLEKLCPNLFKYFNKDYVLRNIINKC